MANRAPEVIAPGDTPDVKFSTNRQNGQQIITDNRVVLAKALIPSFGGRYNSDDTVAIFDSSNPDGFSEAVDLIKNIPHYELDKALTNYKEVGQELRKAGFAFAIRPDFPDNPQSRKSWIYMATDVEQFEQGSEICRKFSRIKGSQLDQIQNAVDDGLITDNDFKTAVGMTQKEFSAKVGAGEVSIGEANKVINEFSAPSEKSLETLQTLLDEKRLTPANSSYSWYDIEEIGKNATQADVYRMMNEGRKFATQSQRNQVTALLQLGYSNKGCSQGDIDRLLGSNARDFIGRMKKGYLNPDQLAQLDAAAVSNGNDVQHSFGKRNEKGYFEGQLTKEQGRENSQRFLTEHYPAAGDAVEVEPPKNTSFAIEAIAATNQHVKGYLDPEHKTFTTVPRGPGYAFGGELDSATQVALHEQMRGEALGAPLLQGSLVMFVRGDSNHFGSFAKSETLSDATVEANSMANARALRRTVDEVTNDAATLAGRRGTVLFSKGGKTGALFSEERAGGASGDEKVPHRILGILDTSSYPKEPTFMSSLAVPAASQDQAATPKRTRTAAKTPAIA